MISAKSRRYQTGKKKSSQQSACRRPRLEMLEKRQLLASDVAAMAPSPPNAPLESLVRTLPALSLSSFNAEGEQADAATSSLSGVLSGRETFAMQYDEGSDVMTIVSENPSALYVLSVPLESFSETGASIISTAIFHTQPFDEDAGFGLVLPNVQVTQNAGGGVTTTIRNLLSRDADSAITQFAESVGKSQDSIFVPSQVSRNLQIRQYADGEPTFDTTSTGNLAQPNDSLSISFAILNDIGTPQLTVTGDVLVNAESDFQVQTDIALDSEFSLIATLDFGDGGASAIELSGLSQVVTHRFTRRGDIVAVIRIKSGDLIVMQTQFPIKVIEGPELDQPLQSENRLLGLNSFDVVAIDSLNRGSESVAEEPEIRIGALHGRVSANALLNDAGFDSLRVRATVSVDIEPRIGARESSELSIVAFVDEDGGFAFHLENELGAASTNSVSLQTRPRLAARFLKLEILDAQRDVVDTLQVDQAELLRRLHPELNVLRPIPPNNASPRPLDLDVLAVDRDLILSPGEDRVQIAVLLHNSQLNALNLPANSRARVEVDFGDGAPIQGVNFDPLRLSASSRLNQTAGFFGGDVTLASILNQNQRDRLFQHQYQAAGEFDIAVTVTMPGGQASREEITISVARANNENALEVLTVGVRTHLRDSDTLIPRIVANLDNLLDFNDPIAEPGGFVNVEISGQSVNVDYEEIRRVGNFFQVEIDVEAFNLLDQVPDGAKPESLDPVPVRLEFFKNGDDRSVVRNVNLDIEMPEILNLAVENDLLSFDIDAGLRGSFSALNRNDILIQIDGLPVEFEFSGSSDPPQRVTPQLIVAQDNGVISQLDERLVEAHFDGQFPFTVQNETLIEDVEFSIRVFSRIPNQEDSPLLQQRDQFLMEATGLKLADLRVPTLRMQGSSARSSIPILVLNDSDRDVSGSVPREGRAMSGLFNGLRSLNLDGPIRAVARQNSVAFAVRSGGDLLSQLDIDGSGNPSSAVLIPLASGEAGFDLFTVGVDGDVDTFLRSIIFNVERSTPGIQGLDSLSNLSALEFSTDDFSDRTLSLTLVRGKDFSDDSDFSVQLAQRRADGQIVLNTVQGDVDAPTKAVHRVRVDWGDGAFDEVDLTPLDSGGDFVEVSHVFELGHRERMHSSGTNVLGGENLVGDFSLSVTEIVEEDGESVTVGKTNAIEAVFAGPRAIRIDVDQDPTLLIETEDSFAVALQGEAQGFTQLKQLRKIVVGQPLQGFVIDAGEDFFDLELSVGDSLPARITRNEGQDGFAVLTLDDSDPEITIEVPFNRFSNEITIPATLPNGDPLFTISTVGRHQIIIDQESGRQVTGPQGAILTDEMIGVIDVVVLPNVDLLSSGDGSLSGFIDIGGIDDDNDVDIILTAIDSPNVEPLQVISGQEPTVIEAIFVREFFVPGRRIRIDVLGLGFDERGTELDTITSRIFTPNPSGQIEEAQVFVSGDLFQLTPLNISILLSETTRQQALDAAGIPLRLTISPGGGEDEIVIFRDADSPAGAFEIEGSADTVFFDRENGIIDLETGLTDDTGLIRYKNFGKHNFRVFNQTTFGATQITILDVLPSVVKPIQGQLDGFGNFDFEVKVQSHKGGQVSFQNGDRNVEQSFEAGDQTVRLTGNSSALQAGQASLTVSENEGDQSTIEEILADINKIDINVDFDIVLGEDGQTQLQVDLIAVFAALKDKIEATENRFESFSFQLDIDDGSQLVDIKVHHLNEDSATATVTVNGNDQEVSLRSFFGDLFGTGQSIFLPVSVNQAGTINVKILENAFCIIGDQELDIEEAVARMQRFQAALQPNGQTTITGHLPFGAQGPLNFVSSSGVTFTIDDVISGENILLNQPGLEPGEQLSVQIGDSPAVTTTVELKTEVDDIGIQVQPNPEFENQFNILFDLNEALAKFSEDLEPGENGILELDIAIGEQTFPLTIAVLNDAEGGFVAIDVAGTVPIVIFDAEATDLAQGIASFSTVVAEGQTIEILIADDLLCFIGEATFANAVSGDAAVSTGGRIISEDATATGSFAVQNLDDPDAVVTATVQSTGGQTTIGDVVIASGQQAAIGINLNPEGRQFVDFEFEPDQSDDKQGQVRIEVPDPNEAGANLAVSTDVFFLAPPDEPEPCEDHPLFPAETVFGGNVIMVFSEGNLTLVGDDANNGIAVFSDERGVVVQSVGGTTLNGQDEAIVIVEGGSLITGDLTIPTMGDGDDLVCITDIQVTGNANVTSTPGDDVVLINRVDFSSIATINVGTDDDIVDLGGTTTAASIEINLGPGDDVLNGSDGRDIVFGGDGVDTIRGAGGDDEITGDRGADIQFGGDGNDTFIWNNGDGPDDNFGENGNDQFVFNGAETADDTLRIVPASDVGEAGDATHTAPDFDLTRTTPSAFTIEVSSVEQVFVQGLGGNDTLDASTLDAGAVDVAFQGGLGDDDFLVEDLISKTFNGGEGVDRVFGTGEAANLNFEDASDGALQQITDVVLDSNATNRLTLQPESLRRATGSGIQLTIRGDSDDVIDIGQGWLSQAPQEVDGLFHQVFQNEGFTLKVATGRPFQNVLENTDVNDDGRTSLLDALLVINAILRARAASIPLADNRSVEGETFFYEDASGDGRISLLDALQVLNRLSRRQSEPEGESTLGSSTALGSELQTNVSTGLLRQRDHTIDDDDHLERLDGQRLF